jgi:hypothetical protein
MVINNLDLRNPYGWTDCESHRFQPLEIVEVDNRKACARDGMICPPCKQPVMKHRSFSNTPVRLLAGALIGATLIVLVVLLFL